eukprot:m.3656 g.3656  ORF g.3656 m.3656 type:complete len:760 (+) comp9669_c0_seq1:190-2469(+)
MEVGPSCLSGSGSANDWHFRECLSANERGEEEDDDSSRLKRCNAFRRQKRRLCIRTIERLSSSDPEIMRLSERIAANESSEPSSTKSSPAPSPRSPGASSREGDDYLFDESATVHVAPAPSPASEQFQRYASYDRAMYMGATRPGIQSVAVRNQLTSEDSLSPPKSKPKSPFRLPWRSRRTPMTPDAGHGTASAACIPVFRRLRGPRSPSPGKFLENGDDDDGDGPYLPVGSMPSPPVSIKVAPKRSVGCFPAVLNHGSNGFNAERRSRSVSEGAIDGNFDSLSSDAELLGTSLDLNDTVNVDEIVLELGRDEEGSILGLSVEHVAEEICLLDAKAWGDLGSGEFENCRWMKQDKRSLAPNIIAMVEWFNRLALMVATQILSEESSSLRARVMSRFIQIAHKLWAFKNFNSLKAILAGLQCTPIFRLKRTWKEVSSKKRKIFRELTSVMSEKENYEDYRRRLNRSFKNPPCIPFLGIFLTDVCQILNYEAASQRQVTQPGMKSRSEPRCAMMQHRRCVSSEVGAGHRITASNPYTSLSGKDDLRVFVVPETRNLAQPLSDSGVGSSDSVHDAKPGDDVADSKSTSTSRPRSLMRSPSSPAFSKRKVGVVTDWYLGDPVMTDYYELFRYGALLDVRAIFKQAERIVASPKSSDEEGDGSAAGPPVLLSVPVSDEQRTKMADVELGSRLHKRRGTTPELSQKGLPDGLLFQLLEYKKSAVLYSFKSRPSIREYLLNAKYNSEEENYRISLTREPPSPGKGN